MTVSCICAVFASSHYSITYIFRLRLCFCFKFRSAKRKIRRITPRERKCGGLQAKKSSVLRVSDKSVFLIYNYRSVFLDGYFHAVLDILEELLAEAVNCNYCSVCPHICEDYARSRK